MPKVLGPRGSVLIKFYSFNPAPKQASIRVTPLELAVSAVTVGDLDAFSLRSGRPLGMSPLSMQWRIAATLDCVHLRQGGSGKRWYRRPVYQNLEPTEKGFLSGLLGGVFSDLVARKVFKVDYFGHIEYFSGSYTSRRGVGKVRPDFLGLPKYAGPTSRAVVVESKGRSDRWPHSPKSPAVKKAKRQAGSVVGVSGFGKILNYAQVAHFPTSVRSLQLNLYDPPVEISDDAVQHSPQPVDLRRYYRDVVRTIDALNGEQLSISGVPYRIAPLELLGMAIGVPEAVYTAVREDQPLRIGEFDYSRVDATDAQNWVAERVEHQQRLWTDDHTAEPESVDTIRSVTRGDGIFLTGYA